MAIPDLKEFYSVCWRWIVLKNITFLYGGELQLMASKGLFLASTGKFFTKQRLMEPLPGMDSRNKSARKLYAG
ncbi:hypothetical protein [Oceanospirillum linum]|uniref:Uncharacterized protein n=1 Tax=Oceanospirillum linum TaxID=966 RepID=A0A1T1HDF3_OCELI|nr:hypothetical protein [Oceanospirillum linum]OOV87832.1 hypothetical protein BTA35_0207475 [Oceanospirillum linum]